MTRLSITGRLRFTFLGLLVAGLGTLGLLSTLWFVRQQSAALDDYLRADALSLSNRLEGIVEGLSLEGRLTIEQVRATLAVDLRTYLTQRVNRPAPYKSTLLIRDDRGEVLGESNAALDLRSPPWQASANPVLADVLDHGPSFRMITGTYPLGSGLWGTYRVACPLSSLDGPLASYLTSLGVILGGSLVLLSVWGAGLIRRTLRPVGDMTHAAEQIGEQNLGARIPLPPGRDEVARLAHTLNGLLGRLESDFAFQQRLVEDLTHQLKTPLTILRGRNELGLSTFRKPQQWRELVEDNLSDIDGLVNLLNTLLALARLDGRLDRLNTVEVDLGGLLWQLVDELEPLWLSKDLSPRLEGDPLVVQADPLALKQLFTNLFDNAWKFSPPGQPIDVRWSLTADREVRVLVANRGPSIPPGDEERIFKRFYRSAAHDQSVGGAGLGLAIVRSLAELHGGRARAFTPEEGGAAFEIVLPYATLKA